MTKVRVSTVCFQAEPVIHFDDFANHVIRLVHAARSFQPEIMVFPEILTSNLMRMSKEQSLGKLMNFVDRYTRDYMELFKGLAVETGCCIIGGTHLIKINKSRYNSAQLFTPEGEIYKQRKLHPIPIERAFITPGDRMVIFDMMKVKVAIATCYDLEFPVVARTAAIQGADILLSPSATLDAAGYWRVRHCAHARCIENQMYVVISSLVGETMPGSYFEGAACVLTPCDKGFPERGVLREGPVNQESVINAELDTELLHQNRRNGTVQPFYDRRTDLLESLYQLEKRHFDLERHTI